MAFGTQDDADEVMNEINMTPLVDVMLVLLVIFIITAPLLTHAIRLDLPQAQATPNDPPNVHLQDALSGLLLGEGGAVSLTTRAIPARPTAWVGAGGGSFGARRGGVFVAGRSGAAQCDGHGVSQRGQAVVFLAARSGHGNGHGLDDRAGHHAAGVASVQRRWRAHV
jgi:hypothetical protein